MVRFALCFLPFLATGLAGQPLRVFSEFVRFGPDGEPSVPPSPREILSPAMPRNGFSTYQILVKGTPGAASTLYVGQNPDNSFQVTLYRERAGGLTKVSEPVEIVGTEVIWMDVWVSRETPVARIKLEPELFINQDWVIYPMEVRVVDAVVPDGAHPYGLANPMEVVKSVVCGSKRVEPGPSRETGEPITPASLLYRNALADAALAERAPKDGMQKAFGSCTANPGENPESYLRIRDYLLRLR